MKKYLFLLLFLPFINACDSDNNRNRNPYLPNYNFSVEVDKINALYAPLDFTGNAVFVSNAGIDGVIVMNTGTGYVAFDAMCPNQYITECSMLEIDGINAICPCDNVAYNLFTGLGTGVQYPLLSYRVEVLNSRVLRISN